MLPVRSSAVAGQSAGELEALHLRVGPGSCGTRAGMGHAMIICTACHDQLRQTTFYEPAHEARAEHGESELLDEIVSAKPKMDHTRYHAADELRDSGLGHLREAMALLERKATAAERDDYRRFVLTLAGKVAAAHREHGQSVSPAEEQAIEQITAALGTTGP